MRKAAAGAALAVITGFSILSASPAMAEVGPFANCDEANAAGYGFFSVGEPGYAPHLDPDGDGMACPYTIGGPNLGAHVSEDYFTRQNAQIVQVPLGAPATGVAQDESGTPLTFVLAAGGTAVLVAGASAAALRRKTN